MPLTSTSEDCPHKMLKGACRNMEAFIEKLPPDLYDEGFAILLKLTRTSTRFHLKVARILKDDVVHSEKKTGLIKQMYRMQDKTYLGN